jgi:hypothetical protein
MSEFFPRHELPLAWPCHPDAPPNFKEGWDGCFNNLSTYEKSMDTVRAWVYQYNIASRYQSSYAHGWYSCTYHLSIYVSGYTPLHRTISRAIRENNIMEVTK